jgi:hypothetical protein
MYDKVRRTSLLIISCVALLIDGVFVLEKTDRGIVSAVTVAKLTMTDREGKNEHSYVIPIEAKVTLNDKEAKITDLQKGDAVTVTIGMEGEVVTVAAKRTKKGEPNASFMTFRLQRGGFCCAVRSRHVDHHLWTEN